jgi:mRNA interferase MazF
MNAHICTVAIAPINTKGRNYPARTNCSFQKVSGQMALDQIGTIEKARLVKKLGRISKFSQKHTLPSLSDLFAA